MENYKNKIEIPAEGIETPNGYLYLPPKQSTQILFLLTSFFTAILLGWIVSSIPGDLSELATGVIYFIFILVFILGYSAWAGRVSILVFGSFKLPIIRTLYRFFIHRKKPGSIHDFLPSREKAIEVMVRAQKAARAFFILSWPIGIAGGTAAMFISTSMNSMLLFLIVAISSIIFGYFLYYFGRRGYIPFPEE